MRVRASILIQRPIASVFAYLSTPNHLPGWVAGVATADGPSLDQQEVGATLALQREAPSAHARSIWEVTAYEPPRTLALRGLDHGAVAEVRWTLEADPCGATRIWVDADLTAVGFFQPAPTHLETVGARQIQEDLELLRRRLEAEP